MKPYAITLDIMMPGFDGWQVLTELKRDAETREIPVIVCSILEQQERGFSLGAADYLLKPILEDDLVNALNRLNGDGAIHEVLVIDDDPEALRLMEKIFYRSNTYKLSVAQGGPAGWKMVTSHPPHAVILDLFMPEMDGFTILEKMRENVRLRDIPVVVVSGGDLSPQQRKELNDFGQRLISKSTLDEKDLLSIIDRTLQRVGGQHKY
jgi:CheY-like chemotaxis protein